MAYAFNALNNSMNKPAQPKAFAQSDVFGAIKQNNQGSQQALQQQVAQPAQQQIQQQQNDFNKQVADYQQQSQQNVAKYKPLDQALLSRATTGDADAMSQVRQALTAANPNAARFDPGELAQNRSLEALRAGDATGILKGQGSSSSAASLDNMLLNKEPVVSNLDQQVQALQGQRSQAATNLSAEAQAAQDAAVNTRKLQATDQLYANQKAIEDAANARGQSMQAQSKQAQENASGQQYQTLRDKFFDEQKQAEDAINQEFSQPKWKGFNDAPRQRALQALRDKYSASLGNLDKNFQAGVHTDALPGAGPAYTDEQVRDSGNIASLLGTANNRQVAQNYNPNVNLNIDQVLGQSLDPSLRGKNATGLIQTPTLGKVRKA